MCGGGGERECGGRATSVPSVFFVWWLFCFCFFLLSSSIKGEETAYQLGKTVK